MSDRNTARIVSELANSYYTITEVVNSQLTYIGITQLNSVAGVPPDQTASIWRVGRIFKKGKQTTVEWANDESLVFPSKFSERETLFPIAVLDNGASLNFQGSVRRIELGDNHTKGPATAFSVSMWVRPQNVSAQRCFISKVSLDANVYGWSFQHTNTGQLYAQVRAPGTLTSHTWGTALAGLTWYNLVFTFSGNSNLNGFKAYINAASEGAATSAALNAWTVTDPLSIAARGTSFLFSGNLNQFTMWNKELSQAEITELYNGGTPMDLSQHSASANRQSHWPMNTNVNFPTEVDTVGSVNGTLINMAASDYQDGVVP